MTETPELVTEMLRLSRLLDKGVQALADAAREYAEAEDDYRAGKATAYVCRQGSSRKGWAHRFSTSSGRGSCASLTSLAGSGKRTR